MEQYALITAARNEAAHIEETLRSVVAQSVLPARWVIVSDGSTDATDHIVESYADFHPFIRFVRREGEVQRDFAGKVNSLRMAVAALDGIPYEHIGVVDGDVSFGRDYYACALARFREDPRLGLVGGVRLDRCNGGFHRVLASPDSAGGPTQFFRRACFEEVGGYLPLRAGGEDAAAEATAKMLGWKVRTFEELRLFHHRTTGTHNRHILAARFRQGLVDHSLGNHPAFELAKCVYRLQERPYVLSSLCRLGGFAWAGLRGRRPEVSDEVVRFTRREQLRRLNPFTGPVRCGDEAGEVDTA